MKTWCIDLDGVITANPQALSWLTYHLCKNENKNKVIILSWRDGSNEERVKETIRDLEKFNIYYHELQLAPRKFTSLKCAAFWKISMIRKLKADVWLDDEIKTYKRDLKINLDILLPEVNMIWI